MKENKGMNYDTMKNSTRFADTMAVLKGLQNTGCPTGKIARKDIYQAFTDSGVPEKYAATALRLPGVRVPNMRSFYHLQEMIDGMEKKFGGTGVSKKTSVKVKKSKVKRVKVDNKVEKPKVIKLQGVDHSAHSPTEEITDPNFGKIESLEVAGLHPTDDDIADELSLMGTYL